MNLNHRITTVAVCSCKTNNYMLMRKKVFLLLSAVCLVSALFTFNAYAGIEDAGDITLPEGDLDVVNRCRCKHEAVLWRKCCLFKSRLCKVE